MSSQAGMIAKTGLSMLYNATVTSVSAISDGIHKAYQSYQDHYEKSQVDSLKKAGRPPAEVLHGVLMRFYYLSMAGYNNEAAAAAQKIAVKLITAASQEKSAVTLDCVGAVSSILVSTCARYGDYTSGGWGLQDFLNSSRMGKDHFDRDQLVNDLYFAILYAQDVAGGPGAQFDKFIRDAAGKMVEGESYSSDSTTSTSGPAQGWAAFGSGGTPGYAKAQGAYASSAPKATNDPAHETDPKKRMAKVLSVLAQAIKKAADDADSKRVRSLKEAEEMLQRERTKAAQAGGVPAVAPGVTGFGGSSSAFGGAPTGFGSGSGFGAAAKAPPPASSGFGSSTFGGGASSGFGGYTAGGSSSSYGSGSSGFGSGSSGFGSGTSGGGSGWGGGGSGFASFGGSQGGGYSNLNSGTSSATQKGGFGSTTNAGSGSKPGQSDWGSLI